MFFRIVLQKGFAQFFLLREQFMNYSGLKGFIYLWTFKTINYEHHPPKLKYRMGIKIKHYGKTESLLEHDC